MQPPERAVIGADRRLSPRQQLDLQRLIASKRETLTTWNMRKYVMPEELSEIIKEAYKLGYRHGRHNGHTEAHAEIADRARLDF